MENKISSIVSVKNTVSNCFPELWKHTEAALATVATLLLKKNSNPTALVFIGQPSTGKTTVLDFFKGVDEVAYSTDYFTPKAFVSHYADKKKETLKNIDMLKRIIGKCLIVADLGVIFGKRKEDLAENLGILTRVLDGKGLATDSGVHGQRTVTGDCMFSMLCATTPFGYRVWDEMGKFGTRLLFMHNPNTEEDFNKIIQCFKTSFSYGDKVQICHEAISEYLKSLWVTTGGFRSVEWKNDEIPEDVLKIIWNLAKLLSKLRAMIPQIWEDKSGEVQYQQPTIENPKRALTLLLNIAKGRAIIYGRNQISMEDVPLLIDIVFSSCPEDRGKTIRELVTNTKITTPEIEKLLNVSWKTADKTVKNLSILKLIEYADNDNEGAGRPSFAIKIASDIEKWMEELGFRELLTKSAVDIPSSPNDNGDVSNNYL